MIQVAAVLRETVAEREESRYQTQTLPLSSRLCAIYCRLLFIYSQVHDCVLLTFRVVPSVAATESGNERGHLLAMWRFALFS